MVPHTPADSARPAGSRINNAVRSFESAWTSLISEYRTMIEAVDRPEGQAPDLNDPAGFGQVAARWGYPTADEAFRAFKQIESVAGRLTTDAAIDGMDSAIRQLIARLKG